MATGPADTRASGPVDTTPGGGGGWFLLKFTNGAIGLQNVQPGAAVPSNASHAAYVGPHTWSLQDLIAKAGATVNNLAGSVGVSAKQQATLISELDHGVGTQNGAQWLYVGPDSKNNPVSSNVSTQTGSEAVPINQIPSPIPPDVGNTGGGLLGGLGDLVSGAFNQAVKDAKYAAVLIAALFIAGFLVVHGITGKTPADASKAYLRHVGRLPA